MPSNFLRFVLFVILGGVAIAESAEYRMLRRDPVFRWPASEAEATKLRLGQPEVRELLDALTLAVPFDPRIEKIYHFGSFRFARLTRGRIHLVVPVDTVGTSGGGFETFAIHCRGRQCETIITGGCDDLDKHLIDSNGDGLFELLACDAPYYYYPYGSGPKIPIITYRREVLVNGEFVDVSARSTKAWEKYVEPLLKAETDYRDEYLASIPAMPGKEIGEPKAMASCAKRYVRAELEWRVYGKPDSRPEETAACLNSPFQAIRDLGRVILSDVPATIR